MSVFDRFSLEGKVAIVTGASSGLGECERKGHAQPGGGAGDDGDLAVEGEPVEDAHAIRAAARSHSASRISFR